MGGSISLKSSEFSYWTKEELLENEKCLELQKIAAEYVVSYMFYGVPTKVSKPRNPTAPVWIEVDPVISINNIGRDTVLTSVPSGVAIDSKGSIKVYFAEVNLEYKLSVEDIKEASKSDLIYNKENKDCNYICCEKPNPPELKEAEKNTIQIFWSLPQPIGISQNVEVQYSLYNDKKSKTEIKWDALCSKDWNLPHFTCCSLEYLSPGVDYIFRLRYKNYLGWSEYSEISDVISTLPDRPSPPLSLNYITLLSDSIHLKWHEPCKTNGSKINSYILRYQNTSENNENNEQKKELILVSVGLNTSHLLMGLQSLQVYHFDVAAVNGIGVSDYCVGITVTTLPIRNRRNHHKYSNSIIVSEDSVIESIEMERRKLLALNCIDAWIERWDPRTEQHFFFNRVTGTRQLHRPDCMVEVMGGDEGESIEAMQIAEGKKIESEFRRKRFRLQHALRRRCQPAAAATGTRSPSNNKKDVLTMLLHRDSMLADCIHFLSQQSLQNIRKRLKVTFINEPGIDSGGVGKEAFLLISRELAAYGQARGWLAAMNGGDNIFFSPTSTSGTLKKVSTSENAPTLEKLSTMPAIAIPPGQSGSAMRGVGQKSVAMLANRSTEVNGASFSYFLGRFLGKALFDRQLVDFPLSLLLLRHLLKGVDNLSQSSNDQKPLTTKATAAASKNDLKLQPNGTVILHHQNETVLSDEEILLGIDDLDHTLHTSLKWILHNNITDVIFETFSVDIDGHIIPLCAEGYKIAVTEANKRRYVELLVLWKTFYSVSSLLIPFLKGFHDVIPVSCFQGNVDHNNNDDEMIDESIQPHELGLMLNGRPLLEVEDIRAYVIYQSGGESCEEIMLREKEVPFGEDHYLIVWLWQLVRSYPQQKRRQFLLFFTGSSRVPLDGFDPPLNITDGVDMLPDSLPRAHTCFNQLVLPHYTSYELMKDRIDFAIYNTEGFDLA